MEELARANEKTVKALLDHLFWRKVAIDTFKKAMEEKP